MCREAEPQVLRMERRLLHITRKYAAMYKYNTKSALALDAATARMWIQEFKDIENVFCGYCIPSVLLPNNV